MMTEATEKSNSRNILLCEYVQFVVTMITIYIYIYIYTYSIFSRVLLYQLEKISILLTANIFLLILDFSKLSSGIPIAQIQLKAWNESVLRTQRPCICKYITFLQDFFVRIAFNLDINCILCAKSIYFRQTFKLDYGFQYIKI